MRRRVTWNTPRATWNVDTTTGPVSPTNKAAEKAVKAAFQKIGAEVWGHSVADLLEELSERHSTQRELIEYGLELDKAYVPTRYPNAHPSGSPRNRYTEREAKRHIEYASAIVEFCTGLLSQV